MMMPEDDEILKNGTVDFVSISYYSSNCVSVTQKGEITAANGGENIKNPYLETSAWGWQIDVLLVQKSHGILRRKIIKRFRQKDLLENNISSKGFLIYMGNS